MTTVHKIVLTIDAQQKVYLPEGAEILCAREQHNDICIWYRCEPDNEKKVRVILIRGTGHPAPSKHEAIYIGTVSLDGGRLMFHVFEALFVSDAQ